MELNDLIDQVSGFDTTAPREKIKLFAWWLHVHNGKEWFGPAEVRTCYSKLHMDEPPALATYLTRMADTRPADLLREKGKYKLARQARSEVDKTYGIHQSVVRVSKLLTDLPDQVPGLAEKAFLQEAMKCYRVEAYRASIIMTWNLAFDHLRGWVLNDAGRLADFNTTIPKKFPKRGNYTVSTVEHFDEFTESEFIEICYTAGVITKNLTEILREKLKRRNAAAHPSLVKVDQPQADDVVTDLVNNVVLALT
jgi:hypothetical protein